MVAADRDAIFDVLRSVIEQLRVLSMERITKRASIFI
jgi:hypothetical protein